MVTKLDAAHRQFITGVRLYFNDGDPVSVHTLICAAREIYERHLSRSLKPRLFDVIKSFDNNFAEKDIWGMLNDPRNFFKHQGQSLLDEIEFSDERNDLVILVAAHDCLELCGPASPLEAHAVWTWFLATQPSIKSEYLPGINQHRNAAVQEMDTRYPGLRGASREDRKSFAKAMFSDGCPVIAGFPIVT